jgi:hypothetical protein
MVDSCEENATLVDETLNNKLLDPRGRYLCWIAVFFMCFLLFGKPYLNPFFSIILSIIFVGAYYCDDNPAGLQDVMKEDLKISSSTFTSFYSWYSWPNVV